MKNSEFEIHSLLNLLLLESPQGLVIPRNLAKPFSTSTTKTTLVPHQELSFSVQTLLHFAATAFNFYNPSPWIASAGIRAHNDPWLLHRILAKSKF